MTRTDITKWLENLDFKKETAIFEVLPGWYPGVRGLTAIARYAHKSGRELTVSDIPTFFCSVHNIMCITNILIN